MVAGGASPTPNVPKGGSFRAGRGAHPTPGCVPLVPPCCGGWTGIPCCCGGDTTRARPAVPGDASGTTAGLMDQPADDGISALRIAPGVTLVWRWIAGGADDRVWRCCSGGDAGVGGLCGWDAVGGGRLWCGRRSGARRARREAEEECVGSWEAAGGRGTGRGAFLFSLPVSQVVLCPSGPTLSPTNTTLAQGVKQV